MQYPEWMTDELSSEVNPRSFVRRQVSLGQQVASAIRRDIILGNLETGSALPQEKLCDLYGVSRIPVRDALLLLANEGFVVRNKRNQMVVTTFEAQDLVDTFRIEAYIASLATYRATLKASPSDLDELEAILDHGDAEPEGGVAKSSWSFHHKLNRLAGSSRLRAMLRAVSLPLLQDFLDEGANWWVDSDSDHRAILEAMREGRAEDAQALTQHHFEAASEALLRYLENHGMTSVTSLIDRHDDALLDA